MSCNKTDIKIGSRIMELRNERGETQKELADAIGVKNRETINQWESGERKVKAENVILLAKHFGVSSDYLLCLSDVPPADPDWENACTYTGLSAKAVAQLHHYKEQYPDYIDSMDYLLESDSFENVLYYIYDFANCIRSYNSLYEFRQEQIENYQTSGEYTPNLKLLEELSNRRDKTDLSEYNLSKNFGFVIQELKKKIDAGQ